MNVLAFHHCEKMPEINYSQEEMFNVVHGFRAFSPLSLGPVAFGLVAQQNIMARNV
jgi:hypothetical protein